MLTGISIACWSTAERRDDSTRRVVCHCLCPVLQDGCYNAGHQRGWEGGSGTLRSGAKAQSRQDCPDQTWKRPRGESWPHAPLKRVTREKGQDEMCVKRARHSDARTSQTGLQYLMLKLSRGNG